ncbi:MAG: hypothetical protein LBQ26_01190 [Holosporales bacterium]|nr:hypothetical protein [Holosporales bacterium]
MRIIVFLASVIALLTLLGWGIVLLVGIPAPVSEVHKILPHEQFLQQ